MNAMVKTSIGTILAFVLTGWSFACQAAGTDKYSNIHSIGIISAIGETLNLEPWGFRLFGTAQTPIPISDWGIDDRTTRQLGAILSPRFTIKSINYNRAEFADIVPGFFFGWSEVNWDKQVQELSSSGVDAYVIVCPQIFYEVVSPPDTHLRGIGFYAPDVYAFYTIIVVDARTGKLIDWADAKLPRTGWGLSLNYPVPIAATEDTEKFDASGNFTPEQKGELKSIVEALIDHSINHALADLDLIDESLKLLPAAPPDANLPLQASPLPSKPTP